MQNYSLEEVDRELLPVYRPLQVPPRTHARQLYELFQLLCVLGLLLHQAYLAYLLDRLLGVDALGLAQQPQSLRVLLLGLGPGLQASLAGAGAAPEKVPKLSLLTGRKCPDAAFDGLHVAEEGDQLSIEASAGLRRRQLFSQATAAAELVLAELALAAEAGEQTAGPNFVGDAGGRLTVT
jgi:hypothetical protein